MRRVGANPLAGVAAKVVGYLELATCAELQSLSLVVA